MGSHNECSGLIHVWSGRRIRRFLSNSESFSGVDGAFGGGACERAGLGSDVVAGTWVQFAWERES